MPSVATAMLVDMVGEAGGLELAVLVGGGRTYSPAWRSREAGLQLQVGVALAPGVGPRCH
jgi:hypothetical protein